MYSWSSGVTPFILLNLVAFAADFFFCASLGFLSGDGRLPGTIFVPQIERDYERIRINQEQAAGKLGNGFLRKKERVPYKWWATFKKYFLEVNKQDEMVDIISFIYFSPCTSPKKSISRRLCNLQIRTLVYHHLWTKRWKKWNWLVKNRYQDLVVGCGSGSFYLLYV